MFTDNAVVDAEGERWAVIRHDARNLPLPDNSVDLIVTSPPYFALRSYRDGCAACGGTGAHNVANTSAKSRASSTLAGKQYSHILGEAVEAAPDCPECKGAGSGHYDGQLGSEDTPQEFIDNLIACMAEWVRVVKPSGSIWVNLGDKYAGSGGHNNSGIGADPERGPTSYNQNTELEDSWTATDAGTHKTNTKTGSSIASSSKKATPNRSARATGTGPLQDMKQGARDGNRRSRPFAVPGIRAKSLMGLPWRFAINCIDTLGLILRAEVIWSKPNGLPESVTDRVRRSHEQWFHFTLEPRYFSGVDEIREPQLFTGGEGSPNQRRISGNGVRHREFTSNKADYNPLGRLPGSVWTIPTEPLLVPDEVRKQRGLPDHFAAFPQEWPRRIIQAWTPTGYCVECDQPRTADVEKELVNVTELQGSDRFTEDAHKAHLNNRKHPDDVLMKKAGSTAATITGYTCGCSTSDAPTRPAVVVDPFGGTGTVAGVAQMLGRYGISNDLSADYNRLAAWRIGESGHFGKSEQRMWRDRQTSIL